MPLGDARDVDAIADFGQICGFDFLADFILRHIVEAEFFQNLEGAFAGLGHVALSRLVNPLGFLRAKTHL